MTADEYDAYKLQREELDRQQELEDDLREQREDEWEVNEENQTWIDEHGGSEVYYTSGAWQTDQEVAAAAAQAQQEETPLGEQDAFIQTGTCSEEGGQIDNDPSSALSEGTVDGTAVSEDVDTVNVTNDNCASISNDGLAGGISGENSVTGNDGPVDATTGNASGDGTIVNQGNTNVTEVDNFSDASASADGSFAEGADAENLSTGEDSENFASGTQVDNLNVDNSNQAYVDNQLTVEGVSGSNAITENDGDVTLTTGDIELIANMLNILNLNITGEDFLHLIVNIFGTLNGPLDLDDIALILGYADDDALEVIAENSETGEDSTNTAIATKEENTDINNTNTAQVNNEMNVTGVSGGNDVSGNDGGANVITGRIQILANLMNFINANFSGEKWSFIMINIFGSLAGDIILPNEEDYLNGGQGSALASNTNVGEDSINTASSSSTDTTSVTNTNGVDLTNNISANGISGNNDQSGNDDGSGNHTMSTGGVDVVTQLVNFLNFNITGNNWVFLVVNVFGTWMGKIVGFGGSDITVNDGTFAALKIGGGGEAATQAVNAVTGEGLSNDAPAVNTTNTARTNQNYASVTNNMNVNGISGENMVNNNDAGTSLATGWVEIDANLLNIINMNVAGRSWMIVFLNVFGNFVGDMIFGRQNIPVVSPVLAATAIGGIIPPAPPAGSGTTVSSHVEAEAQGNSSAYGLVVTEVSGSSSSQVVLGSENEDSEEQVESYQAEFTSVELDQNETGLNFIQKITLRIQRILDLIRDFLAHLSAPVFS